jgi:hypothetical protein
LGASCHASQYAPGAAAPSSWTLLKLWIALLASIILGRTTTRWLASRIAPRERCLFVGDMRSAKQLHAKLAHSSSAILVGAGPADQIELGEEAIRELARRFDIHRIIIASASGLAEERTIHLVRRRGDRHARDHLPGRESRWLAAPSC